MASRIFSNMIISSKQTTRRKPAGIFFRSALLTIPLLFASCSAIQPNRTDFLTSYEGFEQASGIDDAIIYKAEGANLTGYDNILIRDVQVLLQGNNTGGEMTEKEISRLESTFKKTLREEFGNYFTLVSGHVQGHWNSGPPSSMSGLVIRLST
jgi:hypothetical protein